MFRDGHGSYLESIWLIDVNSLSSLQRHQNRSSVSDHCGQRRAKKKNSGNRRTTPLRTVPNTNPLHERITPMNARRAKQLRRLVSMTYNADVTTTPRQYGRRPPNWTIFNTGRSSSPGKPTPPFVTRLWSETVGNASCVAAPETSVLSMSATAQTSDLIP